MSDESEAQERDSIRKKDGKITDDYYTETDTT